MQAAMQQPPVPLRSGPSQSRRVIAPLFSSPAGVDAFDIKWTRRWGNAAMGDPARRRLAARIPSEVAPALLVSLHPPEGH